MRKVNIILASLILFGLMTDCNGNKSQNAADETQTGDEAHGITMTLKVKDQVKFSLGGSLTATVDWGDGSPVETLTLTSNAEKYAHRYDKPAEYTVQITGENITTFDGSDNGFGMTNIELNVPKLTYLRCEYNRLTTLDLSKTPALKKLVCFSNNLTSLDISKNTALEELFCDNNQLTSLDVSKNGKLIHLICHDNQLTSLDVSKNNALINLACENNQLKTIDVSKNTALEQLSCSGNQLTSLVFKNHDKLDLINCENNQLSAQALNALFNSLSDGDYGARLTIRGNPGADDCDWSIAEEKGWSQEFIDRSGGDVDQSYIDDEE